MFPSHDPDEKEFAITEALPGGEDAINKLLSDSEMKFSLLSKVKKTKGKKAKPAKVSELPEKPPVADDVDDFAFDDGDQGDFQDALNAADDNIPGPRGATTAGEEIVQEAENAVRGPINVALAEKQAVKITPANLEQALRHTEITPKQFVSSGFLGANQKLSDEGLLLLNDLNPEWRIPYGQAIADEEMFTALGVPASKAKEKAAFLNSPPRS